MAEPATQRNVDAAGGDATGDTVILHIDASSYRVSRRSWSGDELRRLPSPPVPTDRDLFLIRGSGEDDFLLTSSDAISVEEGMHFFTTPVAILAG